MYYKRMNERVKIVMMECQEGWDTCFCVSMGTNKAEDYSMAVRFGEDGLSFQVKDESFAPYFEGMEDDDFTPAFVEENELKVTVPEIPDKEILTKLKDHPMWRQYALVHHNSNGEHLDRTKPCVRPMYLDVHSTSVCL